MQAFISTHGLPEDYQQALVEYLQEVLREDEYTAAPMVQQAVFESSAGQERDTASRHSQQVQSAVDESDPDDGKLLLI